MLNFASLGLHLSPSNKKLDFLTPRNYISKNKLIASLNPLVGSTPTPKQTQKMTEDYFNKNVKIYSETKEEWIKQMQKIKEEEELKPLQSKPVVSSHTRCASVQHYARQPLVTRVMNKKRVRDQRLEDMRLEEEAQKQKDEMKEATFKPTIPESYFDPLKGVLHIKKKRSANELLTHLMSPRSQKKLSQSEVKEPILSTRTIKKADFLKVYMHVLASA